VIFSILGQPVDTLLDELRGPGEHAIEWFPDTSVASGVYFIQWLLEDSTVTRKIVLVR